MFPGMAGMPGMPRTSPSLLSICVLKHVQMCVDTNHLFLSFSLSLFLSFDARVQSTERQVTSSARSCRLWHEEGS